MGNQNNQINHDKFRKEDWQPVQKLPDSQVWQNKREPSFRIEQYEVYTQNEAELSNQKTIFNLRRRNPLLVAAYYLESHPREQFCSTQSRQSLFIQRIPIRLSDLEHLPFPDYLHLYESSLKGFAQLSRCVGYFPVDQAMIGINERGRVKVWLSQDFSRSSPYGGKITQENMVRNLINVIDRSIDSEQLPRQIPTVRNFLYKNTDSLSFDTAIWQFGEFIKQFNGGKLPDKLNCIDKVGGVYAIANRDKDIRDSDLVHPHHHLQTGTGFSGSNHFQNVILPNNINSVPQPLRRQPIQRPIIEPSLLQSPRQSKIQPKINFVSPNKVVSPLLLPKSTNKIHQKALQQNQQMHHQPKIFFSHIEPNITMCPRSPPRIIQRPIVQNIQNHISFPKVHLSPPPKIQSASLNYQQNILNSVNNVQVLNSPIKNINHYHTVTSTNSLPIIVPHLKQSQHFTQHNINHQNYRPNGSLSPSPAVYSSRTFKTPPKFTVEVVPGKVYPKKSSTILNQGNKNETKKVSNQKIASLFQKKRALKNVQNTPAQLQHKQVQQHKAEKIEDKQQIIQRNTSQKNEELVVEVKEEPIKVQSHPPVADQTQNCVYINDYSKIELNQQEQERKQIFADNNQQQVEIIQNKPLAQEPIIQTNVRQDRNSEWTAGSKKLNEDSIDYEEMERRLAISFNPAFQSNQNITHSIHCEEQHHIQQKENPTQAFNSNHQNHSVQYSKEKPQLSIYHNNPTSTIESKQDQRDLVYQTGKFQTLSTYQAPYKYNIQSYNGIGTYHQVKNNDWERQKQSYPKWENMNGQLYKKSEEQGTNIYGLKNKIYTHIQQNDGKSSPDFLKKLNQIQHNQYMPIKTSKLTTDQMLNNYKYYGQHNDYSTPINDNYKQSALYNIYGDNENTYKLM